MKRLLAIQQELKVAKCRRAMGKVSYEYRTASDILEAAKPLLNEHKILLHITDDVVEKSGRNYIECVCALYDAENASFIISSKSHAEIGMHNGMSSDQATGAAITYARKYALGGLFAIDDSKADPDANDGNSTRAFNYLSGNERAQQYYAERYNVGHFTELNQLQLNDIFNELHKNGRL